MYGQKDSSFYVALRPAKKGRLLRVKGRRLFHPENRSGRRQ